MRSAGRVACKNSVGRTRIHPTPYIEVSILYTKPGYFKLLAALLPASLLVGCGGGSGSSGSSAAPFIPDTSYSALTATDTYTGGFRGDGYGFGGDNGSGDADAGGAAGDGEFITLQGSFPTGSATSDLTWTVKRSQYGIQDSTGTLTVTRNTSGGGGGYTVTAYSINGGTSQSPRAAQSNIFVSETGQITGTLPLPINGGVDASFTALRFVESQSASSDFSAYAGFYAFAQMAADKGTGLDRGIAAGVVKISADGTGRICPTQSWAANCTGGADIVLSYEDPANRSLVRFKAAATQTTAIPPGGRNQFDLLAVFRTFDFPGGATSTDGLAFTADWLSWDSRDSSVKQRTGIAFGSRIKDVSGNALVSVSTDGHEFVGAWNFVSSPRNGSTYKGYGRAELVSGNLVLRLDNGTNTGTCTTSRTYSQITTLPGVVMLTNSIDSTDVGYGVLLDSDTFIYVKSEDGPDDELGIARRYSATPIVGPANSCQ